VGGGVIVFLYPLGVTVVFYLVAVGDFAIGGFVARAISHADQIGGRERLSLAHVINGGVGQ
jgi:hypothetical protein